MNTDAPAGKQVLGVYISGYHITTLIVDLATGNTLRSSYQRVPVNSWGTADEIIGTCATVIKKALTENHVDIHFIGIAMPGPFDYEQGISYIRNNKKHDALYGLNVKQLLAEQVGIATDQLCMLSDAAAFLKGEVFAGVAKGEDRLIGLTLGTGLGTARLKDGVAEDANLWCMPFLDSIAEDYLSERWFLKRYYELSGINVVNVKELSSFYQSSSTVKSVFKEFAVNLANFTGNFVHAVQPKMVVLSGDISRASDCFLAAYKAQLAKIGLEDLPINVSKLNSEAVMIGAATSWLN
ncbi:glucokinase [Mucilaginibacter yixingensis]|uniref:Glucokinase n=1 Tax=Mucilaginibacter yixingensis TaxID=1295612 RepID=A0A2T5JEI8_9SPHI|nr:ROK family protein [Mucilaginibacter yixingensis]PTR00858.1 glucokinase [Mucilaginibacter yixingensis]